MARQCQAVGVHEGYTAAVSPSIEAVRAALTAEPDVRLCVLFGSAARNELEPRSDLDVAVIGIASSRLGALEATLARAAGRPVDLVALETAPPLLRFEVARDGKVLIERSPYAWSDFRARAMVDWWEWAPLARRFHRAAIDRLRVEGSSHGQT